MHTVARVDGVEPPVQASYGFKFALPKKTQNAARVALLSCGSEQRKGSRQYITCESR